MLELVVEVVPVLEVVVEPDVVGGGGLVVVFYVVFDVGGAA